MLFLSISLKASHSLQCKPQFSCPLHAAEVWTLISCHDYLYLCDIAISLAIVLCAGEFHCTSSRVPYTRLSYFSCYRPLCRRTRVPYSNSNFSRDLLPLVLLSCPCLASCRAPSWTLLIVIRGVSVSGMLRIPHSTHRMYVGSCVSKMRASPSTEIKEQNELGAEHRY